MGPMGPPGVDGDNLLSTVIEIEGNFTPANNYLLYYSFPSKLNVYDSDVVLAYILWETASTNNGGTTDVWRPLPQTVILNDGVLQYNFDYTTADVQIFLEGTTDFNKLRPAETHNQIFRIVVVPAAFLKKTTIDFKDYDAVMNSIETESGLILKDNSKPKGF